jgi:uncharacterized protein (DUF488 family)
MKPLPPKSIWTIGHSSRSNTEFLAILHSFNIKVLVDIRSFPGSRKFSHFNKDALASFLPISGIAYTHMPDLGGRRRPREDSVNTAWTNTSFRGYADYMETGEFKGAINRLEELASHNTVAYMCSEAVWWRCHRALVSDYLKLRGWKVMHIMDKGKATEHPFTAPAREAQGKLF